MAAHGKTSTALPALLLVVAILAGTCVSSTHALVLKNHVGVRIFVSANNQTAVPVNPGDTLTFPNTTGLLAGPVTSFVVTKANAIFVIAPSVIRDLVSSVSMALMTVDVGGATTCVVNFATGLSTTFDIAGFLRVLTVFTTCLTEVKAPWSGLGS